MRTLYRTTHQGKETGLRQLGFFWGIAGVILLLSSAVMRLSPRIVELQNFSLGYQHWLLVLVFVPWMAWAEGYRGFHKAFSPRVVARANYLREGGHPLLSVLAPFFCMGYFHATRKRKIVSWTVTGGIVVLILLVRLTPQPWRGIIDAGVVLGLTLGILSLLYYFFQAAFGQWRHPVPLDLPDSGHTPRGVS